MFHRMRFGMFHRMPHLRFFDLVHTIQDNISKISVALRNVRVHARVRPCARARACVHVYRPVSCHVYGHVHRHKRAAEGVPTCHISLHMPLQGGKHGSSNGRDAVHHIMDRHVDDLPKARTECTARHRCAEPATLPRFRCLQLRRPPGLFYRMLCRMYHRMLSQMYHRMLSRIFFRMFHRMPSRVIF